MLYTMISVKERSQHAAALAAIQLELDRLAERNKVLAEHHKSPQKLQDAILKIQDVHAKELAALREAHALALKREQATMVPSLNVLRSPAGCQRHKSAREREAQTSREAIEDMHDQIDAVNREAEEVRSAQAKAAKAISDEKEKSLAAARIAKANETELRSQITREKEAYAIFVANAERDKASREEFFEKERARQEAAWEDRLANKVKGMDDRLSALQSQIKQLRDDNDGLIVQRNEAFDHSHALEADLELCNSQKDGLDKELAKLKTAHAEALEQHQLVQAKSEETIQRLQDQLLAADKKINELEASTAAKPDTETLHRTGSVAHSDTMMEGTCVFVR